MGLSNRITSSVRAKLDREHELEELVRRIDVLEAALCLTGIPSALGDELASYQDILITRAATYRPQTLPGLHAMARLVAVHGTFKNDLETQDGLWLIAALLDALGAGSAYAQGLSKFR